MNKKIYIGLKACVLATGLLLSTTVLADDAQDLSDLQDLYEFNATQDIMAGNDSPLKKAQAGASSAAPIELAAYYAVKHSIDLNSQINQELNIAAAGLAEELNNLTLEATAKSRVQGYSTEAKEALSSFNKASIYAPMVGAQTSLLRASWKNVRKLYDEERVGNGKYSAVKEDRFNHRAQGLEKFAKAHNFILKKAQDSSLSIN